ARSLAASTLITLAEIKPALVTSRTCASFPATCSLVMRYPSSVMKNPLPEDSGRDCTIPVLELSLPFGWHLPWLEIARQPLSLRDLLPGHLIFYYGQIVLCIIITLPRRAQPPLVSLDLILRHAFATVVADAQIVLSVGEILLGSFAKPFHRLRIIL